MNFREAFEHYRQGTANEDERKLVEEELEKNRLICEYYEEEEQKEESLIGSEAPEGWNASAPLEETSIQELKKVRKNLRKRGAWLVLISLTLCAALFLAGTFVVLPAVENLYWDPETNNFHCEYSNDLELTLAAYSELFVPGQSVVSVNSKRTGFASFDIMIQYWDTALGGESSFSYGTLEKNELVLPLERLRTAPVNVFENACYPVYSLDEESRQNIREKLTSLPDYVRVEAAVSFAKDMDMESLIRFEESLEEAYIVWVGIRNCSKDQQRFPLSGMAPFIGGTIRDGINEVYSYFEIKGESINAENLETHFKSLLKYYSDQEAKGRGVTDTLGFDYYEDVLRYVEEEGIFSYGCYMVASPQVFLKLLDSGIVSQVWPENGWLDIG